MPYLENQLLIVVLNLWWGTTQEDLYTIEDRPKGES